MASKRKKTKLVKKKRNFLSFERGKVNRTQKHVQKLSDLGPPELENHHVLKVEYVDNEGEPAEPNKGHKRVRNITQTTLDYCKTFHLINEEQYLSGCRFYSDAYYAGMSAKPAQISWDFIPKGKGSFFGDFGSGAIDAQKRCNFIHKRLSKRYIVRQRDDMKEPDKTNITYWDVVYQICVEELAIDALEKWTNWPRRSGKKLLGLVLDELYDLYDEMHNSKCKKSTRNHPFK